VRSTIRYEAWPALFVLPECNEGSEPAVLEALSVIALAQIDKKSLYICSPFHPKSQKFSVFSPN
jgi:hypothetical protein